MDDVVASIDGGKGRQWEDEQFIPTARNFLQRRDWKVGSGKGEEGETEDQLAATTSGPNETKEKTWSAIRKWLLILADTVPV